MSNFLKNIKEYKKNYYQKNKEKKLAYQNAYYLKNKEKQKEYRGLWIKNNPKKWEEQKMKDNLKLRYDITVEEYNRMVKEQEGKCLICKKTPEKLVIDHSHKTGTVRGLLCHSCNIGIGFLKEDMNIFKSAMEYINVRT